MRLTIIVLGHTFDVSLEPTATEAGEEDPLRDLGATGHTPVEVHRRPRDARHGRTATRPQQRLAGRGPSEVSMGILLEQADRAAIVEALAHHVATCKRVPRHHVERLDLLHGRIDALLDDLELLGWDV